MLETRLESQRRIHNKQQQQRIQKLGSGVSRNMQYYLTDRDGGGGGGGSIRILNPLRHRPF